MWGNLDQLHSDCLRLFLEKILANNKYQKIITQTKLHRNLKSMSNTEEIWIIWAGPKLWLSWLLADYRQIHIWLSNKTSKYNFCNSFAVCSFVTRKNCITVEILNFDWKWLKMMDLPFADEWEMQLKLFMIPVTNL